MTPNEIAAKGTRAKLIIESDVYKEAHAAYEAAIIDNMKRCDSRDDATLKHLKLLLSAHIGARKHLERIMEEGIVAVDSIEFRDKQTAIDKVRRLFG